MKGKAKWLVLLLLVFILFFPIRRVYKDGGTREYSAVLYRMIIWHQLDPEEPDSCRTGLEFQPFPFNFIKG